MDNITRYTSVDGMVVKRENITRYTSVDGMVVKRENGLTPNGNQLNNRWVLRNSAGDFIDFDQYRHDLAERNNIYLYMTPFSESENGRIVPKENVTFDKDCGITIKP